MSHVLLVEDDPAVLQLLQAIVEYGGFESEQASSASEALDRLASQQFVSVLLDLGLPDAVGPHLIEEIRRRTDIPILVVSGWVDEGTIVGALDAGADDFIAKPFMPGELLARMRSKIRRHNPAEDEMARRKSAVSITPRSFSPRPTVRPDSVEHRLLTFLRVREGGLATVEEIIYAIWGSDSDRKASNLRVLVSTVRRKLKAHGEPFEIINEHERGYRLAPTPYSARPSSARSQVTFDSDG